MGGYREVMVACLYLKISPLLNLDKPTLWGRPRVVSGFSRTMGKEVTSILMGLN